MCTTTAVHTSQRQQPQQARKSTTKKEEEEVFFFLQTNRYSDLPFNNILNVIQHCSFFVLSFFFCLTRIICHVFFIQRHFAFLIGSFLPFFLGYLWQRHLLFSLYASLYLFHNYLVKFSHEFNIEQRITNVNDFRRLLHCPVLHFTIHSLLINRNTLDFDIKLNCFVASKMVFRYTPNFLMPALRRQQIHVASCDHVTAPWSFFCVPTLIQRTAAAVHVCTWRSVNQPSPLGVRESVEMPIFPKTSM